MAVFVNVARGCFGSVEKRMGKGSRGYSIFKLEAGTDLEVAAALKNMPQDVYFSLLSDFASSAPELIAIIKADPDAKSPVCTLALDRLQALSFVVGSPSLILKIARLSSSIGRKQKGFAADAADAAQKGVEALCVQIQNAEIGSDVSGWVAAVKPVSPASFLGESASPDKLKALIALSETREYGRSLMDFEVLRSLSDEDVQDDESDRMILLFDELRSAQYAVNQVRMQAEALRRLIGDLSGDTRGPSCGETPPEGTQSGVKEKKRILAVNDVPEVLRVLQTGLREKFNVVGVTNSVHALKYLSFNKADLILLDIEMPGMNVFELLGVIREIDRCKTIPVLFLTAEAVTENREKAVLHGGDDFIAKPVNLGLLTGKIMKCLHGVSQSRYTGGDRDPPFQSSL